MTFKLVMRICFTTSFIISKRKTLGETHFLNFARKRWYRLRKGHLRVNCHFFVVFFETPLDVGLTQTISLQL